MIVVKVGGSLFDSPALGPALRAYLDSLAPSEVLLVPGGGPVADAVRELDRTHGLGEEAAHWLALRSLGVTKALLERLAEPLPPVRRGNSRPKTAGWMLTFRASLHNSRALLRSLTSACAWRDSVFYGWGELSSYPDAETLRAMRFIIANEFYQQMVAIPDHTPDCYVRPGEYLHHMYIDGVKYAVAPAVLDCLAEAEERGDQEAIAHLRLHKLHYEALMADAERTGTLTDDVTLLGDAPPTDEEGMPVSGNAYVPRVPVRWEDLGLELPFLFDLALRTIYTRGQLTGGELANAMAVPFPVVNPVFQAMRKQSLVDIVAQRGNSGDASLVYAIKPPKGEDALRDALDKTSYIGPAPVPFTDYVESVMAQTIKRLVVTRRSIRRAFEDLIITDESFNEIGPAINSAQSIFFFGYPGNGKTSVAERITRLMGDAIYIPHAVEANGQIIKLFDPIQHTPLQESEDGHDVTDTVLKRGTQFDTRFIRVKRPTIVVGGELTMPMLDLKYNDVGKYYEAPLQMKANGGIFMIDDFGRQQVRAMDLLNRWIVPLEKKYDYLNTISGTKVEVPFDQLLIFSTNLDPNQLADEAFLRRIKFKIEIRDPDESQYRRIWELVCKGKRVEFDERGVDYLIHKWYKTQNRPFRMCQPRDILDQMLSIAKYNMERVNFSPDLIDAACATYFISANKKDFGAKVRME